jgi:hypothetical protein
LPPWDAFRDMRDYLLMHAGHLGLLPFLNS